MNKFICAAGTLVVLVFSGAHCSWAESMPAVSQSESIRVGWISALTGPVAKYGAREAGEMAVRDINAAGGIRGKKLELIMEDGRCEGAPSALAAHKLIHVDRVKYILGGHCSTESLTVAPIAERARVIMLASITSSPVFSRAGKYIFRTSPISTAQSQLLAEYVFDRNGLKKLAIIHEDTSYVGPIAEALKSAFQAKGGEVTYFNSFAPGTSDFRTLLTRVRSSGADVVFLGCQAQDTASLLLRQLREAGIALPVVGNEALGNAISVSRENRNIFEGVVFGEAEFNERNPHTAEFIRRYAERYGVDNLPYGVWTAETYDGVRLLADVLNRCGEDVESVRACLSQTREYRGVSGIFGIDNNGDGIRRYILKTVREGKIEEL